MAVSPRRAALQIISSVEQARPQDHSLQPEERFIISFCSPPQLLSSRLLPNLPGHITLPHYSRALRARGHTIPSVLIARLQGSLIPCSQLLISLLRGDAFFLAAVKLPSPAWLPFALDPIYWLLVPSWSPGASNACQPH